MATRSLAKLRRKKRNNIGGAGSVVGTVDNLPDDVAGNPFAAPESDAGDSGEIDVAGETGDSEFFDPAGDDGGIEATGDTSGSEPGSGEPRKRGRGRPKGSGGGTVTRKQAAQAQGHLEAILFSMHQMAAAFIAPEFGITETECAALAGALQRVQEQYEVSILPEKAMVWVQLGFVAAGIYGPRIAIATMRQKKERKPKQPAPVTEFPSTNFTGVSLAPN